MITENMELETYEKRTRNSVQESTLNSRMAALRKFKGEMNITDEPTVKDVENWVDSLIEEHEEGEIKASTIRQYFKAVKYYFQTVHGEYDTLDHIPNWFPENDVDHGDYLTVEEWEAIRENAYSAREKTVIELMYEYARRPGEILLLNLEDFDSEAMTITFPILKKREAFRATFELTPNSERILEQYMMYRSDQTEPAEQEWEEGTVEPLITTSNGRASYDTLRRDVKKMAQRAGIDKNVTPKVMRHSRSTHLDWAGHSPPEIARHQLVHDPDSDVIGNYIHDRSEGQVRSVMGTEED
jgi:site-specific recombinase XerD